FKSIAVAARPSGLLRLGATSSALSGLLPDILAWMKENYPEIDVNIAVGHSGGLYRKVLDGDDLDAAVITEPPFTIPKSCAWRMLREEPLIVLTRAPAPSRKPHAIWHPSRLSDWIVKFGQDASWTTISAKPGYGHENSSRSTSLTRSPSWLIGGSEYLSCQTGRRHGQRAYRSPNCRCQAAVPLRDASGSYGPKLRFGSD